jgi:hypothetical protein
MAWSRGETRMMLVLLVCVLLLLAVPGVLRTFISVGLMIVYGFLAIFLFVLIVFLVTVRSIFAVLK